MGGNIFKDVAKVERIPAEDYARFNLRVRELLYATGVFDSFYLVDSYRNKPDHGDLDIIAVKPEFGDMDLWLKHIRSIFNTDHVASSGDTISFLFRNHQVDLILCDDCDVANFASCYFSWNDLGNFMGRVAHRLGFKFGHEGLWSVLRDPENDTRIIERVCVTLDFDKALEFLGYDYHSWGFGFDNPEDIFKFAASSCWFDAAQFNLSNRSSEARRRDRTRKMYQEMLEYLKEHHGLTDDMPRKEVDKETHLQRAFEAFPEFEGQYYCALEQMRQQNEFKARFNGENYSKWFGVAGKDLGALMAAHRRYFEHHKLMSWIATLPVPAFRDLVRSLDEFLCVGEV